MLTNERRATRRAADVVFTKVQQVCTVVDDFEDTLTRLSDHLGIGPFRCWHFQAPTLYDTTFRGQPAEWTMKLGITWLGDLQYEVIQPMRGASLYREHLEKRGRGVQHVLMSTGGRSFEAAARLLAERSHPLSQTATINPPLALGSRTLSPLPNRWAKPMNLRFGYIDAEATLRTCIEITHYPFGFSERLALRLGKAEHCIPEGDHDFERSLPHRLIDRVAKIGIVTRSVDDTVRAYQTVAGVGPWRVFDRKLDSCEAKVAWGLVGDMLFELVEPRGGSSRYHDILATRGEGVAYLGITPCVGFDALLHRFDDLGYTTRLEAPLVGDHPAAYVSARRRLGTDFEIVAPGCASFAALFDAAVFERAGRDHG
jgi:hypothetical protein